MSYGKLFLLFFVICLFSGCQTTTAVSPTLTTAPSTPTFPTTIAAPTTAPIPPTLAITTPTDPTATPLPHPSATANPAATATATIEGLLGPDTFPPNINPLTGTTVTNPERLMHRPIAIKVSNAPAIVRPQAGLNSADLVFEHYAEGGLTRFTAVFYSQDADVVGSVRSGRLIDLEIPQMYDAGFAFSGASGPLKLLFRDAPFFDRIISPDFGHGGFFRVEDPNKAVEHTLFTSTHQLRFLLAQRGLDTPPQFQTHMAFRDTPLTPGDPATQIEIFYQATNATWSYYAGEDRYRRWTEGSPHLDANTGEQLTFKNIIVLAAHHEDTDFLEDHVGDGHYSIQIQLWGEGPVSIFRNGQRFDGRWRRQDPTHMLTFYDLAGNILPLAPGSSFFQIVPLGFDRLVVTP